MLNKFFSYLDYYIKPEWIYKATTPKEYGEYIAKKRRKSKRGSSKRR